MNLNLIKTLVTLITVTSVSQYLYAGFEHGNGGDECEQRFLEIRKDIRTWIEDGGPKNLELPYGITHTYYSKSMLLNMREAKISCVTDVISVGGAEKTCKNFRETNGNKTILCNTDRFNSTTKSGQYRLVHHEYSGLSEFETNNGSPESNYVISKQLTDFLKRVTDYKLAIKKQKKNSDIIKCKRTLNAMASLIYTYIDAKDSCSSLEKQGQAGSRHYIGYQKIARKSEDLYRRAKEYCFEVCDDTLYCEGPDLTEACLY